MKKLKQMLGQKLEIAVHISNNQKQMKNPLNQMTK
jgi:hypothetical protein